MKIISLNTWGGRGGKENLFNFFKTYQDTDVFCLQEIWNGANETTQNPMENPNLFADIEKILAGHVGYFRSYTNNTYGLAIFVKNTLTLRGEGGVLVNQNRNLQWIIIETQEGLITIVNFHGMWTGSGKGDTKERLLQSDNIVNFLKGLSTPHVLMGDFNLRPETQSIKKLEDAGLRNLIKEYGITSTRTSLYKKSERFADYIFVSDKISVKDFKILSEEVSDHAAMYLECE